MSVVYSNPGELGEPVGAYSQVASGTGRLVALAGQLAVDGGKVVGEGDCAAQVVQVFENVRRALAAEGLAPTDLLQLTTYLVNPDDIPTFYEARAKIFQAMFPEGAYPPNTLLVIARLVLPEALVEMSALAIAPR